MTNQKKKTSPKQAVKKTNEKLYFVLAAIIAAAVIVLFIYPGLINNEKNDEVYYMFKKEGELTITDSASSVKAKLDIEIADTDYERQLGLMKRVSMEERQGMLFIFPTENMQSFWMRNTLISLDMIFINAKKKIVTIHKNTKILSDQSYPSTAPAKYVLEVNAGFTDKHKVNVGDVISWK
ncbi:MAG: DUF192 domain-containing protein [Ignavibacteriaceae bacterium]|nr:DUF192 domain-containing protein [Ignavibacteriaceae bacterium]